MSTHRLVEGDFVQAFLSAGFLTAVTYSGAISRYRFSPGSSSVAPENVPVELFLETTVERVGLESLPTLDQSLPKAEVFSLQSYGGATYLGRDDGLWVLDGETGLGAGVSGEFSQMTDRPALDLSISLGVVAIAHGDGASVLRLSSTGRFRPENVSFNTKLVAVTWAHQNIVGQLAPFEFTIVPGDFEFQSTENDKHYVFRGIGEPSALETPIDD